eukprot:1136870-Pleurochrysis_carterae.AAC.1
MAARRLTKGSAIGGRVTTSGTAAATRRGSVGGCGDEETAGSGLDTQTRPESKRARVAPAATGDGHATAVASG